MKKKTFKKPLKRSFLKSHILENLHFHILAAICLHKKVHKIIVCILSNMVLYYLIAPSIQGIAFKFDTILILELF